MLFRSGEPAKWFSGSILLLVFVVPPSSLSLAAACDIEIGEEQNPSTYMRGVPPIPARLVGSDDSWYLDIDKARWSFQNLSKILRVDPVSRGTGPIKPLEHSDDDVLCNKYTGPDGKKAALLSILKTLDVDGFIALKHGKVVAEVYLNGMRPDTRHIAFSVTKSFVGTLAGVMVDRKLLAPEKRVTHYLPELSRSGFAGASVQDLLDMVAGTEWNKVRLDPASLVNVNAMAGGFIRRPTDFPFRNTLEFLASLDSQGSHGQQHVYNASHTEALAWIITRVNGRPWQRVFSSEIWSRLGAERDAFITVDDYGHGFATAGMNLTLRDLARFGLMLQNRGAFNGSQIVPSFWIDSTVAGDDRARAAWARSSEKDRKPHVQFYKNQFRILDSAKGEFYASGHKGQKVYVDISSGFVVALFSTQADSEFAKFHIPLFRQIATGSKQ